MLIQTTQGLCINSSLLLDVTTHGASQNCPAQICDIQELYKSFTRSHKVINKDKGTWKCKYIVMLIVINTGETVYEKN